MISTLGSNGSSAGGAEAPESTSPLTKLWSKGYELDPRVEGYAAGRNAALDVQLARYDILGSLAHARMLHSVGLLDATEWQALHAELLALLSEAAEGKLQPLTAQEDIHTAAEQALVTRLGTIGKKLHTGRSRNDQVLLDLRLYARDQLCAIACVGLDTADTLLALARRYEWTPMPGYTHMQRAMLSSVGLWAASYAEALLDDLVALDAAYTLNDASPLGSAAAYGVPLPLDRALVAHLLGFARVHTNVLTAANARGKVEAATVQALALIMLDLGKWAQDTLLYSTREFGFFTFPDELSAGSSIMPQKRNLDALELVRARAHTVIALQGQMLHTLAGLPSGYNMDYQETKGPFFEALALCAESLQVVGVYAGQLRVDDERMRAACTSEIFATDAAYELAQAGTPFRDAYRQVAANPIGQRVGDLVARLHARVSQGAPGNLDLDEVAAHIEGRRHQWQAREQHVAQAVRQLLHGELPAGARHGAQKQGYFVGADIALGI